MQTAVAFNVKRGELYTNDIWHFAPIHQCRVKKFVQLIQAVSAGKSYAIAIHNQGCRVILNCEPVGVPRLILLRFGIEPFDGVQHKTQFGPGTPAAQDSTKPC
ncbi:hypothetical protein D3C84_856020 [compost metagenome]